MESSQSVLVWWVCLSCIALFNLGLLIYTYRVHGRNKSSMSPELLKFRNWQLLLTTIYVLGCGFRSVLPREDLVRIVMVDHWISAIAIGRSVATIAELSFILQLSLMVFEAGKFSGNRTVQTLAKIPFPLIVVAEIFSWYACITTNNFGTVIEESLWAISATLIVIGLLLSKKHYIGRQLRFLKRAAFACSCYVLYMVTVDVPNYFRNWLAAEAEGGIYSTIGDGLKEVAFHWTCSRAAEDWQYAMVWMTLYFSFAVWVSLYMVHAPWLDRGFKKPD